MGGGHEGVLRTTLGDAADAAAAAAPKTLATLANAAITADMTFCRLDPSPACLSLTPACCESPLFPTTASPALQHRPYR